WQVDPPAHGSKSHGEGGCHHIVAERAKTASRRLKAAGAEESLSGPPADSRGFPPASCRFRNLPTASSNSSITDKTSRQEREKKTTHIDESGSRGGKSAVDVDLVRLPWIEADLDFASRPEPPQDPVYI